MVHSPIQNTSNYLDSSNPRFNDAVAILHWLLENQDGGTYSYLALSDAVDVPPTTAREFLVPEVWVWRSYDYLLNLRKRNNKAYTYYLSNSKDHQTEKRDKMGCYINISKFHYMDFVASLHGCELSYIEKHNKYVVHQHNEQDQLKAALPELGEVDENFEPYNPSR